MGDDLEGGDQRIAADAAWELLEEELRGFAEVGHRILYGLALRGCARLGVQGRASALWRWK